MQPTGSIIHGMDQARIFRHVSLNAMQAGMHMPQQAKRLEPAGNTGSQKEAQ
jgi:hypothetical protein